jgi:hypothetical protein
MSGLSDLGLTSISPDSSILDSIFFLFINQGKRITIGMPIAESKYRSLIVASGTEKISEESSKKLMMAIHAATYPIRK